MVPGKREREDPRTSVTAAKGEMLRLKSVEVGRTMVEMSSSWWACVQVVVVVVYGVCMYVFEFGFLCRLSRRCRRIKKRGGGIIAFSFSNSVSTLLSAVLYVVERVGMQTEDKMH